MREGRYQNLVSMFLVSAGTLAFEVVLTRIFALTYWHHFASLLISLALTGFGTAGSLLVLAMPWLERHRASALAGTALGAAAAMPLAYLGALAVGLEPLALAWSFSAWVDLFLVCLILVGPFLSAAAHIGLILAWTGKPGRAYAANLAGSAVGCLVAGLLLSFFLPHQAMYPAAGLTLLGSIFYLHDCSRRTVMACGFISLAVAVFLFIHPLPLAFEPFKDRSAALAARGSRAEDRAIGLHGVVEVIGGPAFHYAPGLSLNCSAPLPAQRGLFVDGDLVGPITRLDANRTVPSFTRCLLAVIPYEVLRADRVLVLNPGGALNLLAALDGGAGLVKGVEDNPEIYRLMNGAWSEFSGNIYKLPRVKTVRADPALFLARTTDSYDLIFLGHGGRWGAASGLGVTKLLTVEEQIRMLERLSPEGALVMLGPIMTPPRASIKLLATAAEALKRSGRNPADCLALVRDWNTVLLLVKPGGFTIKERNRLRAAAGDRGFDLSVLPGLRPEETNQYHVLPGEPLAGAAESILNGRADELFKQASFHLRPATRDRPYFFHFFRFRTLPLILDPTSGQPLGAMEWGLLFNWGGLAAALMLAAAGIFLPLIRLRPRPRGMAFFSLIGLGYMLAEIALLAETIYRIGHAALAVPLVIGVFLLSSGLGSRLWGDRPPGLFTYASALALPLALFGLRYLPGGVLIAGTSLIPAALVMGVPFAGGLTHLIGSQSAGRAWAFGLNGFFSVAGALAAGLLCLEIGHLLTVLCAGACYLGAGLSLKGGKI